MVAPAGVFTDLFCGPVWESFSHAPLDEQARCWVCPRRLHNPLMPYANACTGMYDWPLSNGDGDWFCKRIPAYQAVHVSHWDANGAQRPRIKQVTFCARRELRDEGVEGGCAGGAVATVIARSNGYKTLYIWFRGDIPMLRLWGSM